MKKRDYTVGNAVRHMLKAEKILERLGKYAAGQTPYDGGVPRSHLLEAMARLRRAKAALGQQ